MALTADRNTPHKDGEVLAPGVAASTKIYGGGLVAVNAAGYALPAADAASLKVIGRAEEQVDNSSGANGDLTVKVRRKKAFVFKNSATNACTIAHLLTNIYVQDDETVASAGGVNSIVAGKMLGLETEGVLVEVG